MPFSGKATYTAGSALPEIAEDVSDLVGINSPFDTPLLDALGDPARAARSTVHEWLEDALLPNTDTLTPQTLTDPEVIDSFVVTDAARFRVGDQLRVRGSDEVMLVSALPGANTLQVERGYGATTPAALAVGQVVEILGNAALEGDDASAARFTSRVRKANYTQIFSATVEVSGSELAVRQLGLADEMDYQKQQRTRELLRDLENSVINGRSAAAEPQGGMTARRTMRGILSFITTHRFAPGQGGFPAGTALSEVQLNAALRAIWKSSSAQVDLIVVGAGQKRAINQFVSTNRRFTPDGEIFKDLVSVYESDFGLCRILLTRWVPAGSVLLLDSTRIEVMPLAGRSFHYKPLASTGDKDSGQLIGEYTLELRNENAHGVITGLSE